MMLEAAPKFVPAQASKRRRSNEASGPDPEGVTESSGGLAKRHPRYTSKERLDPGGVEEPFTGSEDPLGVERPRVGNSAG